MLTLEYITENMFPINMKFESGLEIRYFGLGMEGVNWACLF